MFSCGCSSSQPQAHSPRCSTQEGWQRIAVRDSFELLLSYLAPKPQPRSPRGHSSAFLLRGACVGSGTACSSARCRTHPDREGCRSDPSPSAPPTRAAGSAQLEGSSSGFFFPGETLQGFPRSLEEPVPSCRARGGGEPGGKVTATKGHSAPKAAPCSSVPSAGEGRLQRAHSSVCSCTLRAGSALPGGFCFTSGVERLRKVQWWRLWLRPPAQPLPVWCGLRGAGFTSLLGEQNSALGAPGTEGCVRKGLRAAEVGTETSQVQQELPVWAPLPSGLPAKEGPDSAGLCPAVHPFPPRREWGSISHAALPSPSRGKPEVLTLFILSDGEKKYAERSERGAVVAPSLGAFSCVFISSIPRWYQHEQATHRRAQQPGLGSSFSSLAPCVCVRSSGCRERPSGAASLYFLHGRRNG